ncbi:MAG: hypothetical protein M1142_03290 [Patescibacteria group bacterium]|nr:hypothetical protein [Patescibacteria group bacterium]
MDPKTRVIIVGALALVILAAVAGTLFYLGKASRERSATSGNTSLNSLPRLSVTPVPSTLRNNQAATSSNTKTFVGSGFNLSYVNSWGVLTCSNSQNFEFDPTVGTDLKGVVCDRAVKPVTVLVVNKLNCQGETVKLGENQVVRSKNTPREGDISYRWCLSVGGKNLDITHRVSASGSQATSKEDFSAEVEQMITTIKASPQGS